MPPVERSMQHAAPAPVSLASFKAMAPTPMSIVAGQVNGAGRAAAPWRKKSAEGQPCGTNGWTKMVHYGLGVHVAGWVSRYPVRH
eukprot:4772734-Prymnesium_polylepis.1